MSSPIRNSTDPSCSGLLKEPSSKKSRSNITEIATQAINVIPQPDKWSCVSRGDYLPYSFTDSRKEIQNFLNMSGLSSSFLRYVKEDDVCSVLRLSHENRNFVLQFTSQFLFQGIGQQDISRKFSVILNAFQSGGQPALMLAHSRFFSKNEGDIEKLLKENLDLSEEKCRTQLAELLTDKVFSVRENKINRSKVFNSIYALSASEMEDITTQALQLTNFQTSVENLCKIIEELSEIQQDRQTAVMLARSTSALDQEVELSTLQIMSTLSKEQKRKKLALLLTEELTIHPKLKNQKKRIFNYLCNFSSFEEMIWVTSQVVKSIGEITEVDQLFRIMNRIKEEGTEKKQILLKERKGKFAVFLAINLLPIEHEEASAKALIIREIERLSMEEMEDVVINSSKLISPEMSIETISSIIQAVSHISRKQRASVIALQRVKCSKLPVSDRREAVLEILGLSLEERKERLSDLLMQNSPFHRYRAERSLQSSIAALPIEEMEEIVNLAARLMTHPLSSADVEFIIQKIHAIPKEFRETIVSLIRKKHPLFNKDQIAQLIEASSSSSELQRRRELALLFLEELSCWSQISEEKRCEMVEEVSKLPIKEFERTTLFANLLSFERREEVAFRIQEIIKLSRREKAELCRCWIVLNSMNLELTREAASALFHQIYDLPVGERKYILHLASKVWTRQMTVKEKVGILSCLSSMESKESSIALTRARCRKEDRSDVLVVLKEVGALCKEEQETSLVNLIGPDLFIRPLGIIGRAIILSYVRDLSILEMEETVRCVKNLINEDTTLSEIESILQILSKMEEKECAAALTKVRCRKERRLDVLAVLQEVAELSKENQKTSLVTLISSDLFIRPMSKDEMQKIVDSVYQLPLFEIEKIIKYTKDLITPSTSESEIQLLLDFVSKIEERECAVALTKLICKNHSHLSLLNVLTGVFKLSKEERKRQFIDNLISYMPTAKQLDRKNQRNYVIDQLMSLPVKDLQRKVTFLGLTIVDAQESDIHLMLDKIILMTEEEQRQLIHSFETLCRFYFFRSDAVLASELFRQLCRIPSAEREKRIMRAQHHMHWEKRVHPERQPHANRSEAENRALEQRMKSILFTLLNGNELFRNVSIGMNDPFMIPDSSSESSYESTSSTYHPLSEASFASASEASGEFFDPTSNPHKVFLGLYKTLKESPHAIFPDYIEHRNTSDQGGVSREFVTRLMKAFCTSNSPLIKQAEGGVLPKMPPFSPEEINSAEENRCIFRMIGKLFLTAREKYKSILIGNLFHPILFEIICSLSEEDLKGREPFIEKTSTFNKLFRVYMTKYYLKNHQNEFTGLKEQEIDQRIDTILKESEMIREEVIKDHEIDQIIEAIWLIAKSMYDSLVYKLDWEKIQSSTGKDLRESIQGNLVASQEVFERTVFIANGATNDQLNEARAFVETWMTEAEAAGKLEDLLYAITGMRTLSLDQKLTIQLKPLGNNLQCPTFSTCFFTMYLPTNYGTYSVFKSYLDKALSHITSNQSAFQGD